MMMPVREMEVDLVVMMRSSEGMARAVVLLAITIMYQETMSLDMERKGIRRLPLSSSRKYRKLIRAGEG